MTEIELAQAIRDYIVTLYNACYIGWLQVEKLNPGYKMSIGIPSYMFPTTIAGDWATDEEFLNYIYEELRTRNYMRVWFYKVHRTTRNEEEGRSMEEPGLPDKPNCCPTLTDYDGIVPHDPIARVLSITKVVLNQAPTNEVFYISVTGDNGIYFPNLEVLSGTTLELKGMPVGNYTIIEAEKEGYELVSISDEIVSILEDDTQVEVVITNKYVGMAALQLKFTDVSKIPIDVTDVEEWNILFDLPAYGAPFLGVRSEGTTPCTVTLYSNSTLVLKDDLFGSLSKDLLEIIDLGYVINGVGKRVFGNPNNNFHSELTTAILPAATYVNDHSFFACIHLVNTSFDSVTTIGSYSFESCINLVSPSFPNVISIGSAGFFSCSNLLNPLFPKLETLIGSLHFYNCQKLICNSFSKITSVGYSSFSGCVALTNQDFSSLVTVGRLAFNGCRLLTSSFPKVTTAGAEAFSGCFSLPGNFPELTTTADACFYHCHAFINVVFPKLAVVSTQCFASCDNIVSIELPLATSILPAAFAYDQNGISYYMPACTVLGGGYNNVWYQVTGKTITLTIPLALASHPEIINLQANNTVTLILV